MSQNSILLKNMKITFSLSNEREIEGVIIPMLSHGDRLVSVETGEEDMNACDALITSHKNFSLGIHTADCAPICFSDGTKIGIAHVGWRGLRLNLIEKMLKEFDTTQLEVYVGPRLDSFEIQKDSCYEAITQKFGETFFTHENEKIIFHFKDAIASLLPQHTLFDSRNTKLDITLPSHRRDGTSKRLLTVVQFKK